MAAGDTDDAARFLAFDASGLEAVAGREFGELYAHQECADAYSVGQFGGRGVECLFESRGWGTRTVGEEGGGVYDVN